MKNTPIALILALTITATCLILTFAGEARTADTMTIQTEDGELTLAADEMISDGYASRCVVFAEKSEE